MLNFAGPALSAHTSLVRSRGPLQCSAPVGGSGRSMGRRPRGQMAWVFSFRCNRGEVGSAWQPPARRTFASRTGVDPLVPRSVAGPGGRQSGPTAQRPGADLRPDTGQGLAITRIGRSLSPALAGLAQGAEFVPGHNLIDFDLPHLSAANPNRRQLQLPMWERKTPRCNRPGRLPDRFLPRGPRNGRPGALRVLATPPAPGAVLPPAAPSGVRPGSPVQV